MVARNYDLMHYVGEKYVYMVVFVEEITIFRYVDVMQLSDVI